MSQRCKVISRFGPCRFRAIGVPDRLDFCFRDSVASPKVTTGASPAWAVMSARRSAMSRSRSAAACSTRAFSPGGGGERKPTDWVRLPRQQRTASRSWPGASGEPWVKAKRLGGHRVRTGGWDRAPRRVATRPSRGWNQAGGHRQGTDRTRPPPTAGTNPRPGAWPRRPTCHTRSRASEARPRAGPGSRALTPRLVPVGKGTQMGTECMI